MGTSNAVNITDGLDGLAIMPMIICSTILGVVAYFTGHTELSSHLHLFYTVGSGELSVFLAAVTGAGLGFLWYNLIKTKHSYRSNIIWMSTYRIYY